MNRSKTTSSSNRRMAHAPRNRHLLDVRMRSETAKRHRRQRTEGIVWNLCLVLSLLVAGYFGLTTALNKFFFKNPEYAIQRVSMELDGILTREEVTEITGIHEGNNIFSVDLVAAEKSLRDIPQISSVRLERELPSQITIFVTARVPVAWVSSTSTDEAFPNENSLLVDPTGFLMKPRRILPDYYHLPVISGVSSDNIHEGEPLHSDDLRKALELLATIKGTTDSPIRIRTLNIAKGYCIEVINDRNAVITFGTTDFEGQLARLTKLVAYCQDTGRELESVNLMVRRNTPVKFLMASLPPMKEKNSRPPSGGTKTRTN